MNKILVPYDGSPAAGKAAEKAIELAKRDSAEVTFLTVVHVPSDIINEALGVTVTDISVSRAAATISARTEHDKKMVKEFLEKLDHQGVTVESKITLGEAAEQILSHSQDENFDLIVMGSRGLSGAKRFLLGSVAQKVIADAVCPVLVVKE